MAGVGLGEAALGAVVAELQSAVSTLQQLESTLKSIVPKINEIDRLNQQLNDSRKGDIVKLRVTLENAKALANKCEDVACWNCWNKNRYAEKLLELDYALLRWCQIDLQVGQSRDIKLILAEVRDIKLQSMDIKLLLTEVRAIDQKVVSLDRKIKWSVKKHEFKSCSESSFYLNINKIPPYHT